MYSITRNKGKEPVIPGDVDIPARDELSSGSSPSLGLSSTKNTWESKKAKSCNRPSRHPAFSDGVSGAPHRVKRETSKRQNQAVQAIGNTSVLLEGTMPLTLPTEMMPPISLVHFAFGIRPTFYIPLATSIRIPDDMLSSSLGRHILNYEPPRGFF